MAKQATQDLVLISEPKSGMSLPVTQADVDTLVKQRELFHTFVKEQLVENVDFGIIPGTPKPSLYKPGAEKLAQLFGLGTRVTQIEKIFEREGNFALLNYKAEVFVLRNQSMTIAQCDGSCNSQEKKYKERTIYKWNPSTRQKDVVGTEPTPVCDILNTLQKMAQKRAIVGAVILATGASDFFSQDIEDEDDADQIGVNRNQKPAPTTIKAAMPKATSAASKDMSQGSAQARPIVQTKQNQTAQGSTLFNSKAETLESVQDDVWMLKEKMGHTDERFMAEVYHAFKKPPEHLNLEEVKKLRSVYSGYLSDRGVK